MSDDDLTRKNARMGFIVMAVVCGMIGLAFASVPLYSLFCAVTGYGGTTQTAASLPGTVIDRTITVQFDANTARGIMWDFKPEQRRIDVKLGQRGLTAFSAYNPSDTPTSGTAIYNVTPLKAGLYFNKVQCFCFDEQTLQGGEHVSMPVLFYIDPAMNDDPNMDDVKNITLSYTFFPANSQALDTALDAFYNAE